MTRDQPDPSRAERHATSTRGFLFADLRGYTAFVERYGAHRAAAMLDRYRSLVRSAVAEFDGAEIRTEGDSFYVVFDSASAAIECGLAIVAGAQATDDAAPDTAFQVGIGIHAGETVETAEGYVGSAVNTAARICAQAGLNQVLVSGTVRALTAGVVAASFVPIGRRRLKGLRDPIELFRAVAQGAMTSPGRGSVALRPGRLAAAAVGLGAVLLVIVLLALVVRSEFGSTGEQPGGEARSAPASGPAESSAGPGASNSEPRERESRLIDIPAGVHDVGIALQPGRYTFSRFRPTTTFTVTDDGWRAVHDEPDGFELQRSSSADNASASVAASYIQVVHESPCFGSSTRLLEQSPHALVEWLQSHPNLESTSPAPVNIGGYPGLSIEISHGSMTEDCAELGPWPENAIYLFRDELGSFALTEGRRVRIIVVDVDDRPITLLMDASEVSGETDAASELLTTLAFDP